MAQLLLCVFLVLAPLGGRRDKRLSKTQRNKSLKTAGPAPGGFFSFQRRVALRTTDPEHPKEPTVMSQKSTASAEPWYASSERTSQTDDQRIKDVVPLPPPEHLIRFFPIAGTPVEALVGHTRSTIRRIMQRKDDRLLVIMGPCSIHDPAAALEYARRLKAERDRRADTLEIVMRVYFEKPRTTVGWKGLINDPYLDESYRIDEGLRIARQLLLEINRSGLPAGGEFLDVISPQYLGDLVAWGAIGARTTESQVHRELASGLSAPVGFKNGTDGNIRIAIDAIQAAARPHHFLSVHKNGQVAIVETRGNRDCHVILRGGKTPNYDASHVAAACKEIEAAKLDCTLMIDCSHANSGKQHERQLDVARDVAAQLKAGTRCIFGVMVESHLKSGAQKFSAGKDDPSKLVYGQSITDACLGWDESLAVLDTLGEAVKSRRLH
jgi:3-deoxy-7-phosphoheptulonate synthase